MLTWLSPYSANMQQIAVIFNIYLERIISSMVFKNFAFCKHCFEPVKMNFINLELEWYCFMFISTFRLVIRLLNNLSMCKYAFTIFHMDKHIQWHLHSYTKRHISKFLNLIFYFLVVGIKWWFSSFYFERCPWQSSARCIIYFKKPRWKSDLLSSGKCKYQHYWNMIRLCFCTILTIYCRARYWADVGSRSTSSTLMFTCW